MALVRMKTHHLKKGMVIKSDIYNRSGVILVTEDTVVTKEVFELLTKHFIDEVLIDYVTETPTDPIPIAPYLKKGINQKKLSRQWQPASLPRWEASAVPGHGARSGSPP